MSDEPAPRHLRRRDYVEMPWRNGGGVTFEIARAPPSGVDFDWRLSLALIERSGPFSSFTGCQRAIALVSGPGCILHGIDATAVALSAPGDRALFSGSAAVECELVAGPCHDLNLMVREPGRILAAKYLQLSGCSAGSMVAAADNALFCLEGVLECVDNNSGRRILLARHDTLLLPAPVVANWQVQSRGAKAAALTYAWQGVPADDNLSMTQA